MICSAAFILSSVVSNRVACAVFANILFFHTSPKAIPSRTLVLPAPLAMKGLSEVSVVLVCGETKPARGANRATRAPQMLGSSVLSNVPLVVEVPPNAALVPARKRWELLHARRPTCSKPNACKRPPVPHQPSARMTDWGRRGTRALARAVSPRDSFAAVQQAWVRGIGGVAVQRTVVWLLCVFSMRGVVSALLFCSRLWLCLDCANPQVALHVVRWFVLLGDSTMLPKPCAPAESQYAARGFRLSGRAHSRGLVAGVPRVLALEGALCVFSTTRFISVCLVLCFVFVFCAASFRSS
jgi:hypothetical protein